MIPRDEAEWQAQCAELDVDETGRDFRDFIIAWCTRAEEVMHDRSTFAEALNLALSEIETERGRVSSFFLGQMLVVIISQWVYGHALAVNLTPIERRLMEDSLLLKLDGLARQAAIEPEETV